MSVNSCLLFFSLLLSFIYVLWAILLDSISGHLLSLRSDGFLDYENLKEDIWGRWNIRVLKQKNDEVT